MLSGVGIICFAASYGVALALEMTRLFFRSGIRGAMMLGFAGAGLFAHTVYLYYRAASATGSPLSSSRDWCLVAAWILAATYLYLTAYHPKKAFGLFILPLVLALIGVGTYLADPEPFARGPASKVWGMTHGVSILLAAVAVLVGFAAGLMYLGQAYRLKHKLPPRRGLRLPSLEWLQHANRRAIGIAVLMLGAGIVSGIILNLINYGPQDDRLPWTDPVVLSTFGMFAWLVMCVLVGRFYKPVREGHRVAFLTLLSFLFLLFALAVVLLGNTQHGGSRGRETNSSEGRRTSSALEAFVPRYSNTAKPQPNPNLEIRDPKQIQNPKPRMTKSWSASREDPARPLLGSRLPTSHFGLRTSDFRLPTSDFGLPRRRALS